MEWGGRGARPYTLCSSVQSVHQAATTSSHDPLLLLCKSYSHETWCLYQLRQDALEQTVKQTTHECSRILKAITEWLPFITPEVFSTTCAECTERCED